MSGFKFELVPAEVTTSGQNNEYFFLGSLSPNLWEIVALNEGKSFRNIKTNTVNHSFWISRQIIESENHIWEAVYIFKQLL